MDETPECNTDPRAPHGFDRNASLSADRYVCECEGWEPPPPEPDIQQNKWPSLNDAEVKAIAFNVIAEGVAKKVKQAVEEKQPKEVKHWSDCAVHNEPAYPNGECDCGGYTEPETVAWMWKDGTLTSDPDFADGTWTPLFAAPPKREWVGLTDEEIKQCIDSRGGFVEDFARAIEAKLKEKNT
jgi:hypothetical protein